MTHEQIKEENYIDIPESLPLLTVYGAMLLPHARQPLNIHEPAYLHMIDDALGMGRMVGVIQPRLDRDKDTNQHLYSIGTVARIVSFAETEDGRYIINLQGLCRFQLVEELDADKSGYRRGLIDITAYQKDLLPEPSPDLDRERLMKALAAFFALHAIQADWGVIKNAASEELLANLVVLCPLSPNEKQAILEAQTHAQRMELFVTLLEMAAMNQEESDLAVH